MGVLPKGHLVECERADLVGEYIGHTAQKTREQIRQALGGILFIDEAYSLARGGEKDFGKEAIDTLVKAMEDKKDQLVLILAGYRREMELFLQTNPGLRSRFPIQIDFPDYKTAELIQIADLMLKQREYRLTDGARRRLHDILEQRVRSRRSPSGQRPHGPKHHRTRHPAPGGPPGPPPSRLPKRPGVDHRSRHRGGAGAR